MNIVARARPSITRASARVGPGLATPLAFTLAQAWSRPTDEAMQAQIFGPRPGLDVQTYTSKK